MTLHGRIPQLLQRLAFVLALYSLQSTALASAQVAIPDTPAGKTLSMFLAAFYWTLPYVPGPRLGSKPAFVLTSGETFSGAEEFTYDLQTQKRATIVGEVTGGGAHPMDGMPLGDHFRMGVPVGRPVNPITKTDWEGVCITPDVKVSAAQALETAQKLAIEKLTSDKPPTK